MPLPSRRRSAACLVFLLALAGCASAPQRESASAPAAAARTLLLVSLDGVHPDLLEAGLTPTLSRIARDGVRAEWMNPAYPSLTFPNHYTLVTGLRPDRHGIVHNTMHDPALGDFSPADRDAVGDGRWWQGEPLWVGVQKAGRRTATMFWPGSEAAVQGRRPDRWHRFVKGFPVRARVDQVLRWLDAPEAARPQLATLYFEQVDAAAHDHGPRSAQARTALRTLDAELGRLLHALDTRGLLDAVDLVVVSDHGMAEVPPGQAIAVESLVDAADAEVVAHGQVLGFRPRPGRERAAEAALLGAHAHHDCWRRQALPARWRYGRHPRVPPIVCQMHEGWDAIPQAQLERRAGAGMRGSHGYDPALASMRAIFLARGPSFRRGVVLPPFDNVHLYPLLAQLLGIPPAPNDGDPDVLRPALRARTLQVTLPPDRPLPRAPRAAPTPPAPPPRSRGRNAAPRPSVPASSAPGSAAAAAAGRR